MELPEMGITFLEKLMHGDLVHSFLYSTKRHSSLPLQISTRYLQFGESTVARNPRFKIQTRHSGFLLWRELLQFNLFLPFLCLSALAQIRWFCCPASVTFFALPFFCLEPSFFGNLCDLPSHQRSTCLLRDFMTVDGLILKYDPNLLKLQVS